MLAKPVRHDEQIKLIMECRQSGLTDFEWCRAFLTIYGDEVTKNEQNSTLVDSLR